MKLYCQDGVVVATHADDQMVPASAYGGGVSIITRAEGTNGLSRIGEPPEEGAIDLRPFAAPEVTLEATQAAAVAELSGAASALRQRLSGASDPFKAAVYNQRAAYGRLILSGTASAAMLTVARSEAVRIGMAASIETADPTAIAEVWRDLDERLALAAAMLDTVEAEGIAAIEQQESATDVAEELAAAYEVLAAFAAQAEQAA